MRRRQDKRLRPNRGCRTNSFSVLERDGPPLGGRDHAIQPDVVRIGGHFRGYLPLEGHPAFGPRDLRKKAVVITFASPQPRTVETEAYPRNEDQVQID